MVILRAEHKKLYYVSFGCRTVNAFEGSRKCVQDLQIELVERPLLYFALRAFGLHDPDGNLACSGPARLEKRQSSGLYGLIKYLTLATYGIQTIVDFYQGKRACNWLARCCIVMAHLQLP